MHQCHEYQRYTLESLKIPEGKSLVIGCQDDPAGLSGISGTLFYDIIEADTLVLPFESGTFESVVLGDFLEHCPNHAAIITLNEINRILVVGGKLILTFPLDYRYQSTQPESKAFFVENITSWHSVLWYEDTQIQLFKITGFEEVERDYIKYSQIKVNTNEEEIYGWGILLQKQ